MILSPDTLVEAKLPKSRLKKVIVVASLIITALIILIVVLILSSDKDHVQYETNKLCTTKACIKTGKNQKFLDLKNNCFYQKKKIMKYLS